MDASEVFQKIMTDYFGDVAEVVVDDLLVWGLNRQDHDRKLLEVLKRARQLGLKLNKEKLEVGARSVSYVGHLLTDAGVKPDPNKVQAITETKTR